MSKIDRDLHIISHILQYSNEVDETVTRFGNTFECFDLDKIYQNAATMCILQIGELVGRFSYELKRVSLFPSRFMIEGIEQ